MERRRVLESSESVYLARLLRRWSHKAKDWKLQINIKNLTDRRYNLAQAGTTDDAFGGVRVGTAAPRTASLSLSVAF